MIPGNGSAARLEPFRRTPPGQKQQSWVEDQEMIPLRLIVPAVLAASAAAGCITYFVTPLAQVEADERLIAADPAQCDRSHRGRIDKY